MSLHIGQIRKNGNSAARETYLKDIGIIPGFVNTMGYSKSFQDFAISPRIEESFSANNTYYLRFTIKRIPENTYQNTLGVVTTWEDPNSIDFSLILYKDAGTAAGVHIEGTYQTIENKFLVEPYKEYVNKTEKTFEVVFTPNDTYKYLAFETNKISYDYIYGFRNPIKTNTINFTDKGDLCIIQNILNQISDKIGVQTKPGTLLCVNHEAIRVGRSGIYEVNNGVKINFVGITSPNGDDNSNINNFILDYAWNA